MSAQGTTGKHWHLLALVLGLGLWARTWWGLSESVWIEELHSIRFLDADTFQTFLRQMLLDNGTPPSPAYFFLEYHVARLFGTSPLGLRLLSLVFGLSVLPATYLLTFRVSDARTGLLATFLAAASMPLIFFSQEIRMYAPMPLLATLSLYTLIDFVERPRPLIGLGHCLINALLIWTHIFGWLFVLPEGIYLLFAQRRAKALLLSWFAAHAAMGLIFAAWLSTADISSTMRIVPYFTPFRLQDLAVLALVLGGGRFSNESPARHLPLGVSFDWLLALTLFVVVGWHCLRTFLHRGSSTEEKSSTYLLLLLLCVCIPPAVLTAVTIWFHTTFQCRYLLYCIVPFCILAAAALTHIPRSSVRRLICSCVVCLSLYQLSAVAVGPLRPDWRGTGNYLSGRLGANDLLVIGERHAALALAYNSRIPLRNMTVVDAWPAIGPLVLAACARGDTAWVVLLMHSSPERVETSFLKNGLEYTFRDFAGWPNIRVYAVHMRGRKPDVQDLKRRSVLMQSPCKSHVRARLGFPSKGLGTEVDSLGLES